MADSDSKSLNPSAPAPPWMIVTFFLVGVAVVLAALWRKAPPGTFQPPLWVPASAGGLFVLASLLMALQGRSQSLLAKVVLATFFTDFAALFDWVGLGPGPRQFSGSTSFLGVTTAGAWSPSAGRIVFSAMGILVSVVALLAWVSVAKALVRGRLDRPDRSST